MSPETTRTECIRKTYESHVNHRVAGIPERRARWPPHCTQCLTTARRDAHTCLVRVMCVCALAYRRTSFCPHADSHTQTHACARAHTPFTGRHRKITTNKHNKHNISIIRSVSLSAESGCVCNRNMCDIHNTAGLDTHNHTRNPDWCVCSCKQWNRTNCTRLRAHGQNASSRRRRHNTHS